ncbi:MAG: CHASE4 domain-containing protein, partial [Halobacteriota archaeon]
MRLQSKMIAIVGVIVLITILMWVLVAEALFMGNYQQLERNDVQDALDATSYALDLSVSEMNQTARDYASWDDTYNFVVNNNTNYVTANLVES